VNIDAAIPGDTVSPPVGNVCASKVPIFAEEPRCSLVKPSAVGTSAGRGARAPLVMAPIKMMSVVEVAVALLLIRLALSCFGPAFGPRC
jgi:hypothetical protein